MPVPVLYPKVSLEMSSGVISRWIAEEGASVTAGQVLFEIENDKAAVEVEAPASGVLRGRVAEGVTVEVGDPVARILVAGEADAELTPAAVPAAAASATFPVAPTAKAEAAPTIGKRSGPNPTPLARRIARAHGISLAGVPGTGPRGRVQRVDVMAELVRIAEEVKPAAPAARPQPVSAQPKPARATVTGAEALNTVWLRRGSGVPVVLLHGFSGDLNNWRGLLAGARPEWPALAIDLPAHGGSPRAVPTDLDAAAEWIEAQLAAEGITDCVLAAHSFGSAVAARIASRGRVDVRGLCLFSPAGLYPAINRDFTQGILRARQPQSLRPWLELLVHDPKVISDAFVQAVVKAREDEELTFAMEAFAETFFPDGTQAFSIREDLAKLSQPVRVIFGYQDAILPFGSTKALPGNVGLHALADCGHMPHLEHPGLSLRLLSELWRSAI